MYKIIVFILGFCVLTSNANENTPPASSGASGTSGASGSQNHPSTGAHTSAQNTPNSAVIKLNSIIEEMMPLTFDANQYNKATAKAVVQKNVAELLSIIKNTPELSAKKSNSAQISYAAIAEQLEQTNAAFEQKNYFKAGEILKGTAFLFIQPSTHTTQDAPTIKITREQFSCDFAFAEYSYAIRDYQNAITYYDKYLTSHQPKPKANTKLALERLLSLYTQIDKDPQLTATYLKEYMPYLGNDRELKTLLQDWMVSLDNMQDYFDDEFQNSHFLSFASLQNYVASLLFSNVPNTNTKTISDSDKVRFIVLRGMLLNYLNETKPADKEKPMLLYWLALCNKKLNDNAYYTFTSLLLKECFSKYPNHSYAPLCKGEYEQLTQSAWLTPIESH